MLKRHQQKQKKKLYTSISESEAEAEKARRQRQEGSKKRILRAICDDGTQDFCAIIMKILEF